MACGAATGSCRQNPTGERVTFFQALVLAAVQGATEFLPVSSSGHLVLARRIFGWSDENGLLFDIILHAGSLTAILVYFWRDAFCVISAFKPSAFAGRNTPVGAESASWRRLPFLVLLATLPTAVAAPFIQDILEQGARTPACTGASMLMTALWFILVERRAAAKPRATLSWRNALAAGCAQIVALLPGASRSGWTAGAGLLAALPRQDAVRFAFYMAVPAIAGAIVFELPELYTAMNTPEELGLIAPAFCMSFLFSLAAIHFCLRFFKTNSLRPFALYLAVVGLIIVLISHF